MALPSDAKARKQTPIATGCLDYFPDALAAVARLSLKANRKHNGDAPLHWSKGKSADHADCLVRHLLERGKVDEEMDESHTVHVAWRALALLQTEIECSQKENERSPKEITLSTPLPPPGPVVSVTPEPERIPEPPADDE